MENKYLWRWLAFIQALIASVGSLGLSAIWGKTACILCYYQRVLMIALAIIIGAALLKPKNNLFWFAFPLALIGGSLALYQHFLLLGAFEEPTSFCVATNVSCINPDNWIGSLTIPALSFTAFLLIIVSLSVDYFFSKKIIKNDLG